MKHPFFSIVLVNYNSGEYLEQALLSVINQDFDDYEFIVVDGGSTDNSVGIIEKYQDSISWWISEPDKGQSDAFNKGFSHAQGEFFTWINADDLMLPGTLRCIKNSIMKYPKYKWFVPNTVYIDQNDNIIRCNKGMNLPNRVLLYGGHGISPSSFFHKSLLFEANGFVVDYHYNMDDDLWMKFMLSNHFYKVIDYWAWGYRIHDKSKTTLTIMGEKNPKIDAEFEVIYHTNNHRPTSLGLFAKRVLRCFWSYPLTLLFTLRYKGKNVMRINK